MCPTHTSSIWQRLQHEQSELGALEPRLMDAMRAGLEDTSSFAHALTNVLIAAFANDRLIGTIVPELFGEVLGQCPEITEAAAVDLQRLADTNPACTSALVGLFSFRGYQAVQVHRIGHALWQQRRRDLAVMLQNLSSRIYAIDIHPAVQMGSSVMVDHGIGVVVGETAVIEDGVCLWQGVTLGATLTQSGDRHPKVRRNALICTGACVLGNIEVGEGAVVAAGSVVLKDVPSFTVVAGSPARVVGKAPQAFGALAPKSISSPFHF